jgi:hypothetical protein
LPGREAGGEASIQSRKKVVERRKKRFLGCYDIPTVTTPFAIWTTLPLCASTAYMT